ncbi:MAG: hypothetical protein V1799_02125 [bacterium]
MLTRTLRKLLLLFFFTCITANVHAQVMWFEDHFQLKSSSTQWAAPGSEWMIRQGSAAIQTRNYDQLFSSRYYLFETTPYSIEVVLRGIRAGIYFSLDDTASKALSQMIRFDEKNILTGFFNGAGEFIATSTFESPVLPTDWTTLLINVDPVKRRYEVIVNDKLLGVDTALLFQSGYFGLQASEGTSEFQSVRIFSDTPSAKPPTPVVGAQASLTHIHYLRTERGNIQIYLPEHHLLQTLNPEGIILHQVIQKTKPIPDHTIRIGTKEYSISNKTVQVLDTKTRTRDFIANYFSKPVALAANKQSLFISDAGTNGIFEFDHQQKHLKSYRAEIIGGFKTPSGIALLNDSTLLVADYDRIVFLPLRSVSPKPLIHTFSPSEAEIRWTSHSKDHPTVSFQDNRKSGWERGRVTKTARGAFSAILNNLTPSTRYSYQYSPALMTIPLSAANSRLFKFVTLPSSPKKSLVTRLPVLCMVYRTITYRDAYPKSTYPSIPDGRSLSKEEIEYLKQAIVLNREFYFRNSSCRLALDFDFFVVEDTLYLRDVGVSDPYWLSPNNRVTKDYERAASSFNRSPEYYAGLICPYAWINYPPRRKSAMADPVKKDSISIRQAIGGGTYGIPAPWKFGKNAGYTSNPFQDRFSRQDWLITHEFHHQIDALMERSGYEEYYHADIPWKMPGRFGEDFDFNAQIMRLAEKDSWLTLNYGQLYETEDADQDGVPDNDPSLPFDEQRLGGNPALRDTDNDGLNDLQEIMAGTSRGTLLNSSDSDSDGILDGNDPEPLYPIQPRIDELRPGNDLWSKEFGRIESDSFSVTFALAWTDSSLILSTSSDKHVNILFQIDAQNDGWFHGFDNIQLRLHTAGDSMRVGDYYLRDCSSFTDPPRDRRDILHTSNLSLSLKRDSKSRRYVMTIAIPKNELYGLTLAKGKKLGIRLGVQTTADLWVWEELFERNYMMSVELQ